LSIIKTPSVSDYRSVRRASAPSNEMGDEFLTRNTRHRIG